MSLVSDDIQDVAREIGKKQRDREVRQVLIVIVAFGAVSLLILLFLSRIIVNQTDALNDSINNARVADATEQAQLEHILDDIDDRMVPRSDVILLQAEVEELQGDVEALEETNRKLTRAVNTLTEQVATLTRAVRRGG